MSPSDWYDHAACAELPVDLFFPQGLRGRNAPGLAYGRKVAAAKSVCAGCLVVAECLEAALENRDGGIRGGLTEDERDGLTRRIRPVQAACGTDSGYYRHVRLTKTKACDDCKAAHSAANSRRASEARGVPPHPRHGATA